MTTRPKPSQPGLPPGTDRADGAVEVALLDRHAVIVAVNQAWTQFCLDNGGDPARCGVGASYLAACDAAPGDASARVVGRAVRAAVAGEVPAAVQVEVDCHAARGPGRFDVLISSRFDDRGTCVGATVTLSRQQPAGRASSRAADAGTVEQLTRLAVQEDRRRIARDLHDTVVQDLIALGLQMTRRARQDADPAEREHDREMVAVADQAVRRLREAVFRLRDPVDPGLSVGARRIVSSAARLLGHDPTLTIRGPVDQVPDEVAANAAAVLQEGLSNVARHAGASATAVTLSWQEGAFTLVVQDDGRGVETDARGPDAAPRGDGLTNLHARAQALGGAASVSTPASGGTLLVWSVPITVAAANVAHHR